MFLQKYEGQAIRLPRFVRAERMFFENQLIRAIIKEKEPLPQPARNNTKIFKIGPKLKIKVNIFLEYEN